MPPRRVTPLWVPLALALTCPVGCGDGSPLSAKRGPAERPARYSVVSHHPSVVTVLAWEGFGFAAPMGGRLAPGKPKIADYDVSPPLPAAVTVRWKADGESEIRQQELSLDGLVTDDPEKLVAFTLDATGVWHVALEERQF